MAFGDVIQSATGSDADPVTFASPVAAGNSIIVMARFRDDEGGAPSATDDDLNSGNYTRAFFVGDDADRYFEQWFYSGSIAGIPVVTFTGTTPRNWFLLEVEGAVALDQSSTDYSAADTTSWSIPAQTVAANSVSYAGYSSGFFTNLSGLDAAWTKEVDVTAGEVYRRADATSTSVTFTATSNNNSGYAAGWASYTQVATLQEIRKSSTFDIETTLSGTITTATLNSVNVADHITGQVGTTVNFAGAATDEITTSGEYTLTLGDGTGTENITVQVNVVGLASNTAKKDGGILASLSDIELEAFDATGTHIEQLTGLASNASAVMSPVDFSSTTGDVGDNLKISLYSPSSQVGITFTQALEAI